jgi:AraC-like DNA-binding protein
VQRLLNDPPPTPTPRTSEHPIREMYALYESGASLLAVCREFGVSERRLRALFREMGLEIRSSGASRALRGSLIHQAQLLRMHELYESGASLGEVGEKFGVSKSHVGGLFRAAGLQTRPRGVSRALRTAARRRGMAREMHRLYDSGATIEEVAKRFKVSAKTVRRSFRGAGLQTRSGACRVRWSISRCERIAEMYELYRGGASTREVAEGFAVTQQYVQRLFRQAGLGMRPPSVTAALRLDALVNVPRRSLAS